MSKVLRWSAYAAGGCFAILFLLAIVLAVLWRDRDDPSALDWPVADSEAPPGSAVSATWFGVSTLLFDDGETQILVDGTFTRISALDLLLQRKVRSDIGTINYAMDEFRMQRLAAIVPVHAHYEHAIDVGNVANRSSAVVLGSESVANIARGAKVPVDQYQIIASGETRYFGQFTITTVASRHAALGPRGTWFADNITEPLVQPARSTAWQSGGTAVSVILEHPRGTSIVHGSAGFVDGALANRKADVVFLAAGGLAAQGREHTAQYWQATIGTTAPDRVLAVHFDDFTQPFGETQLFPRIVDDLAVAATWLNELATDDGLTIERPEFGVPIPLY